MYKRVTIVSNKNDDDDGKKNVVTKSSENDEQIALVVVNNKASPSPPKTKNHPQQHAFSYPRSRLDLIFSLQQEVNAVKHHNNKNQQLVVYENKALTGRNNNYNHHNSLLAPISSSSSPVNRNHNNNNLHNDVVSSNVRDLTQQVVQSIYEGDPSFVHRSRGKLLPPLALELSAFVRRENQRIEKQKKELIAVSSSSSSPSHSLSLLKTTTTASSSASASKAKLTTVRETINCLASHFPDYSEMFGHILQTLDESLLDAVEMQKYMSELDLLRNSSETIIDQKISEAKEGFDRQIHAMMKQRQDDEKKIQKLSIEVEKAVGDCNFHKRRLTEKQREYEEMMTRTQMFQRAMEEETKRSIELTKRLSRLTATNKQLRSNVEFMDKLLKDAESQIEKASNHAKGIASSSSSLSQQQQQQQVENKKRRKTRIALRKKSEMILEKFDKEEQQEQEQKAKNNRQKNGDDDDGQESNCSASSDDDDLENESDDESEDDPDAYHETEDHADEPVPRRMDEAHLNQLMNWKEKLFHLDVKQKRLASINNDLMEDKKRLQERIDTMTRSMERQNEALTPRPNWLRVNEVLPRFSLNTVASSDEVLDDVLLLCQQELTSVRHEAEARIMGNVVHEFLGEENLCESDLVGHTKHFIARGTGPHVPVYLRATGVIKNRRMRKYGAEAVLKKFWAARRKALGIPAPSVNALLLASLEQQQQTTTKNSNENGMFDDHHFSSKKNKKKHLHLLHKSINQHLQSLLHPSMVVSATKDTNNNNNTSSATTTTTLSPSYYSGGLANKTPIDHFFIEFLTELTGTTKLGIELAYNILSVCEQFPSDADCSAILRVLHGEVAEFIIYDQLDMLVKLEAAFHSVDVSKKGKLSRATIHRVLHLMFPAKKKEDMLRLRLNLALSCGGEQMVDIRSLFREDEEANQSRFVETLRSQHLEEVLLFGVEVEEALRETTRISFNNNNNNNNTLLSFGTNSSSSDFIDAFHAKHALKEIDPAMPDYICSEIIAAGCNLQSGKDLDAMLIQRAGAEYEKWSLSSSTLNSSRELPTPANLVPSSPSSLKYPIEPFLERIRKNVLVKRYGKRPGREDVLLGGILHSPASDAFDDDDRGGGRSHNKKSAASQQLHQHHTVNEEEDDDDDDEKFFNFMKRLHDDDDDDEDQDDEDRDDVEKKKSDNDEEKTVAMKNEKRKSIVTANQPQQLRRQSANFNSFARVANSSSTGNNNNDKENPFISSQRRRKKSIYAEAQLDKLLADESDDDEEDDFDEEEKSEKRKKIQGNDDDDDLDDKSMMKNRIKKQISFRDIFQRKVEMSDRNNNNNNKENKNHQNDDSKNEETFLAGASSSTRSKSFSAKNQSSAISSMANVVTATVAAENFRRLFQQQQQERDAIRRKGNATNNRNKNDDGTAEASSPSRRKSLVSIAEPKI